MYFFSQQKKEKSHQTTPLFNKINGVKMKRKHWCNKHKGLTLAKEREWKLALELQGRRVLSLLRWELILSLRLLSASLWIFFEAAILIARYSSGLHTIISWSSIGFQNHYENHILRPRSLTIIKPTKFSNCYIFMVLRFEWYLAEKKSENKYITN